MSDIPPAAPPVPRGLVHEIAEELAATFSLPAEALKIQRATRLWVTVDQAQFAKVFEHLYAKRKFIILCTITGLDVGEDLEFIYHLACDAGVMANLKTRCRKGGTIKSVTPIFPGAAIYERELIDLLGATVDGIPAGPRYPLPDNWPENEHPLLKDWKSPSERAAAAASAAAAAAAPAAPAAPATPAPGGTT
jgi:Ni,Fe-hydrogenase III component G